jgi:ABC-type thiamin/hydroxymethylpyrimidine transport system permease subunit
MTTSPPPDQLPLRWAVILLAAAMAALVVGALTFAQTASWPTTLLAALGAGGTAIPLLYQVLGQ